MNKTVWSIISLLMVGVMLLTACGPKAAAPAPTTPTPAPAAPTPAPVTPAPTPSPTPTPPSASTEKPKYGGTINLLQTSDIRNFDQVFGSATTFPLTNEHFMEYDWARGSAGNGETTFVYGAPTPGYYKGHIAESWELPEIGTYIYKIRRGIRYALNPASGASRVANGREFTADDAVFSVKRVVSSPRYYLSLAAPGMAKSTTAEKTGPWEVTIKSPVDPFWGYITWFAVWNFRLQAPEEVQKYGDANDWRNSVGTGPFMLTDFVPGSTATFARNPNYWDKDPIGSGKGNQLPYVDTVKLLIVPDTSTQVAALRTGRLDWASSLEAEDGRSLVKSAPKLKYTTVQGGAGMFFGMRTDKPELPFKDKRVRQALHLATDFKSMKNDLFGGEADILSWPLNRTPELKEFLPTMEELPAAVQALYGYNPEKAKQLLAEAGYPNGFKTKVIVENRATMVDRVSAVKSMWAKVGVELEIQPRETSVYTSMATSRAYDEMLFRTSYGSFLNVGTWQSIRGDGFTNASFIGDSKVEAAYQEAMRNIVINWPKVYQLHREVVPHLLEQAYVIPTPLPYTYRFWQPWVKNYYGESSTSLWLKYAWIDQDLREQTTGRR